MSPSKKRPLNTLLSNYAIREVNERHQAGGCKPWSRFARTRSPRSASDNGQVIYFGGYDGNWVTNQDTAWIFRTTLTRALSARAAVPPTPQ